MPECFIEAHKWLHIGKKSAYRCEQLSIDCVCIRLVRVPDDVGSDGVLSFNDQLLLEIFPELPRSHVTDRCPAWMRPNSAHMHSKDSRWSFFLNWLPPNAM